MPNYDAVSYSPPAPVAAIEVRQIETGRIFGNVPMLLDTGALGEGSLSVPPGQQNWPIVHRRLDASQAKTTTRRLANFPWSAASCRRIFAIPHGHRASLDCRRLENVPSSVRSHGLWQIRLGCQ